MNKETIKYFDIVLSKIENHNEFSIGVILFEILKPNESDQKKVTEFNNLVDKVNLFGRNEDFFKPKGEDPWNSLTPEGKTAKKLGGYFEYEKYIEKKDSESESKVINNSGIYIESNENNGTQSFEKTEVKKNRIAHKTNPIKKPSIWESIKSFCVKFWWTFIIPLIVVIIGILIERGIIDVGI